MIAHYEAFMVVSWQEHRNIFITLILLLLPYNKSAGPLGALKIQRQLPLYTIIQNMDDN